MPNYINLEEQMQFVSEWHDEMTIETYSENHSGEVLKALVASSPICRPCDYPRPPKRLAFWIRYA